MEKTLWVGRPSVLKLLNVKDIILSLFTGGIWLIFPLLQIFSIRYELTENTFTVTKGLITKKEDYLDLVRVKDIRMKKGLITGELTIITSDKSDSVINVTGISNPQSLKDKMRSAVKLSKQKAGVTLHESI